jgi:hypothetical protein
MGKMMKQFGRTMLTVMGLAVAAAVLSSIPAQAAGPGVVAHAFVPGVAFFTLLDPSNPFSTELVEVEVVRTAKTYMLVYNVFDFGGGFSAAGSGSIPASSVNVSGGSVNTGNVTVTLNVKTCDVTGFTTTVGPCGTFDLTWVEVPASIGGSFATRGDTQLTSPQGGKVVTVVTNGETEAFSALTAGTALGFELPTPTFGGLTKETNVTVTVTGP